MFATAYAQTAGAAPAESGMMAMLVNIAPLLLLVVFAYFLLIRPQQQRMKKHQAMIAAMKRGDTVVLSNGMIGKITRIEDAEAMVEVSQGVNVRVVRSMIAEVRGKGVPANDAKA
ncbi:preprotein translocase subunit YajC [Brevundimonas sp. 2R-24]|uniref:Sec translocon accessory complex subunit YajC n=1 Tax=Peiella sedimenti TaxID=3061083 RepID=A0ABT8SI67_9CAUL|nr:preprotein translocase subunit YajC [Caulobacteraceae bacterium XZ-24]